MGNRRNLKLGLLLTLQLVISVKSQGYGNIEDDSAAPSANNQQQQQISSLPQYDPDPEGAYGQAPAPSSSNLQENPGSSVDQSQAQDFWWNNKPAFQKPAGHPGLEQSGDNNAAAAPQSNNRAPNSYNPSQPQQNNFQQSPQPQRPQPQSQPQRPYKPQPTPSRTPYNNNQNQPGGGWNGPSSQAQQPAPQSSQPFVVPTPECQLLNKADCHKRAPTPQEPSDQGYNNQPAQQLPPQNYRPPSPQKQSPQRNPPQQQQQQQQVAQPPPGFYQPPSQQPYDSQPQNSPSNQNYQPQQSYESQPQSSSFPQSGQRPQPQPYRPSAPQQQQQPQQQYNRPAPQQPQQQYQNNGQYSAPQSQPNQYYQSQQPQQQQQQQAIGQPVIGPIDDQAPFPGCPAAMLCVQDDQCNLIGVIEDGLRLSFADKAHRVALSKCSEPSTGIQGICCRDPNYKDPWPDMNGGGNSGQYKPHHHDKGNHHQEQQAAEPQGNFRNPYAEFGDRKKKSPSVPSRGNPNSNSSSSLYNDDENNNPITYEEEPEIFHPCQKDESCIIHYKCANKNDNGPKKKCKEDIFRNPYHCCKLSSSHQSTTFQPFRKSTITTTISPTTTPHYEEPSIFTIATSRPLPTRRPNHFVQELSPIRPTLDSIYKNNPFLTDTFPPDEDYSTSTTTRRSSSTTKFTTENTLITGLGLRFHSHLHSQANLEANLAKPNPYIEVETGLPQPAIINLPDNLDEVDEITEKSIFSDNLPKNVSENTILTSSAEPQGASSNHRLTNASAIISNISHENGTETTNSTQNIQKLPENYTEVYEPPANRTREILQNFWNVDNNNLNSSAKIEDVQKRIVLPPPARVPLRDELVELSPPGYIFKEYDLYVPEYVVPAGFFQPPQLQFGEREWKTLEDLENEATTTTSDDVTTILPEMINDEGGSLL